MTLVTKTHPVASIVRIIRCISINVVTIYFYSADLTLFAALSVQFLGSSNPVSLWCSPQPLLCIVAFLGTESFSPGVLVGLALKGSETSTARNYRPGSGAEAFSSVPVGIPSEALGVRLGIRAIMAEPAAIFVIFHEAWINRVGRAASLTCAFNFRRHLLILTG